MKTGQEWIESSERRALELGVIGAVGVPVGVAAVASGVALKLNDPSNPVMHFVERARIPSERILIPKLGDPYSSGRLATCMRKAMLDETPQLLKVGTGEMALIGPRPDHPEHIARLAESVDDPGLRDYWIEVVRAKQKMGIASLYANWSHRNNLEGRPEATRFGTDPVKLRNNANRRAKIETWEFDHASPQQDAKVIVGMFAMAAINYGKYTRRGLSRLGRQIKG